MSSLDYTLAAEQEGERLLTLPSLHQVLCTAHLSGSGLLGRRSPGPITNPSRGSSSHGEREKEQIMNVTERV